MPTIRQPKNRGGKWLARVRVKGYKTLSKAFIDKATAESWAEAEERRLKAKREQGKAVREDVSGLTVKGLIEDYWRERGEHQDEAEPTGVLAWWRERYGTKKVHEFANYAVLRDARESLQASGVRGKRGDAAVNRYLAEMRSCWNWGRATELIAEERTWPKRLMKPQPKGRIRFLSQDEIQRLLKAAEADKPIRAAIIVSIATGMRQGEMLNLTWNDVDLERKTASLLETKNGESRSVPLTTGAVAVLRELQEARKEGAQSVFVNLDGSPLQRRWLSRRWERILTTAEITDFHWHDLRHTCASILAQNGATLQEIQTLLGHKSMHMTFKYSHLVAGRAVTGHDKLDEMLGGRSMQPAAAVVGGEKS